jgi:hypothetical protein
MATTRNPKGPTVRVHIGHGEAVSVLLPGGAVVEVIVGLQGRFVVNAEGATLQHTNDRDYVSHSYTTGGE